MKWLDIIKRFFILISHLVSTYSWYKLYVIPISEKNERVNKLPVTTYWRNSFKLDDFYSLMTSEMNTYPHFRIHSVAVPCTSEYSKHL